MVSLTLIPQSEFQRIAGSNLDEWTRLQLVADMARANALTAVKRAGSGHLGSSFSAMDIVTLLYYRRLNTVRVGIDSADRDIYFSSKGHDVPGLYAVLYSLAIIPEEKFLGLRRYGGLEGHPDISTPGIEANSGSLGMGISKGRGMAWAKRAQGHAGQVFVLTGDGEWQEGQNYEALQAAVQQRVGNLNVIIDHNKLQSDKPVSEIINLGDLNAKLTAFGWRVERCDGHDLPRLDAILQSFQQDTAQPKILIADTIKGRGISFMEHPQALRDGNGLYRWHAGAPPDEPFQKGYAELLDRIQARLKELGLAPVQTQEILLEGGAPKSTYHLAGEQESQPAPVQTMTDEYVAQSFGDTLVDLAPTNLNLVVLDGDLAADCRIRSFELKYPDRFIENGIAEQDMVSMAGGLASQGMLPVVNSFASFMAARANEQIYNNASEKTKIIYACHYAGLIPAGPGKSHQSIRDISLFGALPNVEILQPCNALEARWITEYCVQAAPSNCVIRLVIGPSPRRIELPSDYKLQRGRGAILRSGQDGILFGYGPVMLHEALLASELLAQRGFGLTVVDLPWLNRIDREWFAQVTAPFTYIHVVEDHSPVGGLGSNLLETLVEIDHRAVSHFEIYGVEGYPAFGTPPQALAHHKLSGALLAERILHAHDR